MHVRTAASFTLLAPLILVGLGAPSAIAQGTIAIRAGEIHAVEGGRVHKDGILLVQDGRIVAVGSDVQIPPHAQVIDYGPDAVIVPGFVAPHSGLAEGMPPERTAEPGLVAVDGFDFYAPRLDALAGGVTSAYITPARGRLIAGQAAIVKLAGDDPAARVLRAPAALHAAISEEARRTPGYWQPPVPATSDVGLGVPQEQLPRTTMGALLALRELLDGVRERREVPEYGPTTVRDLAPLVEAKVPWRVTAMSAEEIGSLLVFAQEQRLPLIVHGARHAGTLAKEIAAARARVVYELPYVPNRSPRDRGVDPREPEPALDAPAKLRAAGVPVAFALPPGASLRDQRFAAIVGSRGGVSAADALRGLTLTPAEFYGVDDRVGSLAPGKHADFVVMTGAPLDATSNVRATWIEGRIVYEPEPGASDALVVRVQELHLGDGHVLTPGEVLVQGGRIVEVGARVGRPAGAVVLSAPAAMPGMIDVMGRLGLGGARRTPATDYSLGRIAAPGDRAARAVAKAGVTTIVLDPTGQSASGVPMLAYRPAAAAYDGIVVADPVGLRFTWTDANRARSGVAVKDALTKAVEYRKRWTEYEEKLAAWKEPETKPAVVLPQTPEEKEKAAKAAAEAKEAEAKEAAKEEPKSGGARRRGNEPKPEDPDPVTGIHTANIQRPPFEEAVPLRMQLRLTGEKVEGVLRSAALADELIDVRGVFVQRRLDLTGVGRDGLFRLTGTFDEAKLTGEIELGAQRIALAAERTSRDYPVAARTPVAPPATPERAQEPKDKPREPRADPRLEPLRRALDGKAAVFVDVDRGDEIVACVEAFAAVGLKPILVGASDIHKVLDRVAGKVAGVVLDHTIVESRPEDGIRRRNRLADLQRAGIPVAFHSAAEDGARDLPLMAAYAISEGMSPVSALRALTSDAATMLTLSDRVGRIAPGLFGDLVLLDGSPLDPRSSVLRVVVGGKEVQ